MYLLPAPYFAVILPPLQPLQVPLHILNENFPHRNTQLYLHIESTKSGRFQVEFGIAMKAQNKI